MPPEPTPRWDPATQRWVTNDPAAAPEPAPGPTPAPAPGPAPTPAPDPDPASGHDPAPAPPETPARGHDPAPGQPSAPAPGSAPAAGPAPAPGYVPPPLPGYAPAPGPGPGGYGPGTSAQDPQPYPYPAYPYPQPGQPVYPEPPPPARAPRRLLTPATAAVAVAALALGAATVWFVARDTGEQPPQAGPAASDVAPSDGGTAGPSATDTTGSPSPTATDTATGSPTPSPSPSGSDPAHETVRDAKGFTIAVPTGWLREESAAGVFYRSPDRAALVQVFQVSEPELTPLAAVRGASAYLRAQTTGYQEISVGPAPDAPGAGELVYEYDSAESHGRRRGVERVFVAEDGKKWAVLTAGPAPDWTLIQTHHRAALTAFRPTAG
ncbi:hypothetical protein ACFYYB_16565 [Streptomyces sp. NPDC002886]|uniref:hypothetical protein n=1 Tax=Streptomyces sp. NPDC002886 TaxID=3364667 RepID=UPI0036BB1468